MAVGTILSLEQATALPYATQRFVQLGWRVIRIEATGGEHPGDPNRYVGHEVAGEDRHAAFIAPNVGKESIALNLKSAEGREALKMLVKALDVDVFCCNVLPKRYVDLGIDYESLSAVKPDLIWVGISALGPRYPDTAGYDPVIQAMSGLMDLNGDPNGPPTLIGLPLSDLKAGDEVYANILLALLGRAEHGRGKRIDVSMLQVAVSWLTTVLPLIDLGAPASVMTRTGNAHRQFVPTNVYPARDGHIYLAIGNNGQWAKLLAIPGFEGLDQPDFATLEKRTVNRNALYAAIGAVTSGFDVAELEAHFAAVSLPHSTINTIAQVIEHPAVAPKLTRTRIKDKVIRLTPSAVDLEADSFATSATASLEYTLAPHYGEHTDAVLSEAGLDPSRIEALRAVGAIA